jgi:iron complex transport system substrate-binding protein
VTPAPEAGVVVSPWHTTGRRELLVIPAVKTRRFTAVAAAILVLAIAISAGCLGKKPQASAPPQAPGPFPLTVTDGLGRSVTIPAEPQRIISLAPSCTEVLFALGLGSRVVGVDKFSNYPPEVASVEKVGGFSDPSLEKITSLKPDLILGTSMHKKFLPQLEALGVPVLLFEPRNVDEVLANIKLVGRATGCPDAAEKLAQQISSRIERVRSKVQTVPADQRPWVYYEVYSEPIMTVGPGTLIHQLIELAGGRNIAYDAQTDYPQFSSEVIIQRNPDVIIFPSFHGSAALTPEKLRARPGWARIRAVKEGHVYAIDADIISRPGPRIADAVEELAHLILPQQFPR